MEIRTIECEHRLVFLINNQHIHLTPFLTSEHGLIKIGIDAPRGITVDREEIYLKKQNKLKSSGQ